MNEDKLKQVADRLANDLSISIGIATGLVEDASVLVLDYTNRDEMNDSLWVYARQIATIAYNKQGVEGEVSRSEGGVSHTFIQDIPTDIQRSLNRYRVGKVVSYYAPKKE